MVCCVLFLHVTVAPDLSPPTAKITFLKFNKIAIKTLFVQIHTDHFRAKAIRERVRKEVC